MPPVQASRPVAGVERKQATVTASVTPQSRVSHLPDSMLLLGAGILAVWAVSCRAVIRPSDILNVEYLPSTLLLEEATLERMQREAEQLRNTSTEGDLRDAFLTMQYHRTKMNEYMCRVYVADEILSGMGEGQLGRVGTPAANHRNSERDQLLADQGSASYRDWLSRSTLLDDVYRHYDSIMAGTEDIESGEVTGYAVQGGGKTTATGGSCERNRQKITCNGNASGIYSVGWLF